MWPPLCNDQLLKSAAKLFISLQMSHAICALLYIAKHSALTNVLLATIWVFDTM